MDQEKIKMTVETHVRIARAFNGDLFIVNADENITTALNGCSLEDNRIKGEEKIPVQEGIYNCNCHAIYYNNDQFYIEIFHASRVVW